MKTFVQRFLCGCGPSEQPPPPAPPLPPLEAPLAAPQQQPLVPVQAAPQQQPPLVPVQAPQPQPPLVPVQAAPPQPLVPVQAPQQQPQPFVTLRAPAPVPPPPSRVEPLGTLLRYEGSSMELLNDGIIAYLKNLEQDPAEFVRLSSLEPLYDVPIVKKLEAAVARRAVKGTVSVREAKDNEANQVSKAVLKAEIERYLRRLGVEVKHAKVGHSAALSEDIELVRIWVVSFRQIWFGAEAE